jgi:hypothetical protein
MTRAATIPANQGLTAQAPARSDFKKGILMAVQPAFSGIV